MRVSRRSLVKARVAGVAVAVAAATLGAVAPVGGAGVEGPALPGPGRTEVAGAGWAGRIAVAGGLVAAPSGFAPTRDLWVFRPTRGSWSRGPDLPGPRDHAALATLGGRLYLVGGYTTALTGPTREVWRLDGLRSSWVRVADLTVPRAALAVAATRGHLVAVGGANDDGVLKSTEWYDARRDEWRAGPDLATPREHLGASAAAGRVYAIGGRNPVNLASVESLAIAADGPQGTWRDEPSLEHARGGNGAATVAGRPCTAGGEEAAGTIGSIECLAGARWEHVADLQVPRHGLAVVARGKSLHVIAGGTEPGATFSTTHEIFTVAPVTGTPSITSSPNAAPVAPVTVGAVGDLVCPPGVPRTASECHQQEVSDLLLREPSLRLLVALGDLQYENGTSSAFHAAYDPSYGRLKDRTRPAPGNHEYGTPGAAGYFEYFGAAAGDPATGSYSFDVGTAWHLIALNSNCGVVSCAAGSAQERWLRADLTANTRPCVLAYWHHPRFSSGAVHGNDAQVAPFWDALATAGAEIVLSGHEHTYERFEPQDPSGRADPNGIREFVVGTGGRSLYSFGALQPNSAVRRAAFGALFLTLGAGSYDWRFVDENGAVLDQGSGACHQP